MRRDRSFPLVLLMTIFFGGVLAFGQTSGDERNAATWYGRAFEQIDTLSESDWEQIASWDDPQTPPPPGVRAILARARPMLALAARGGAQMRSDFALDYAQGLAMELTHLPPLRRLARLVQTDALVRLHDGDASAAASDVATLYRMAEQLNADGTMISSLIGNAIFDRADAAVQFGVDRAAFDAGDAETMRQAIEWFDASDPFGIVESLTTEQDLVAGFLDEIAAPETRPAARDQLRSFVSTDAEAMQLALMSEADMRAGLAEYDAVMGRVIEAFLMEDRVAGQALLRSLTEEVMRGEHGFLVKLMSFNFERLLAASERARTRVAERTALLDGLAEGVLRPEEQANAALLYAKAIAGLAGLDRTSFTPFAIWGGSAAGRPRPIPQDLRDFVSWITDLLREAAARRRCDFSVLRTDTRPRALPDYVAGLATALQFLDGDARSALAERKAAIAVDRLAIVYGIITHLSGDEPLASAVVAHHAFRRAEDTLRSLRDEPELLEAFEQIIGDEALRVPRTDPFGYIGSVLATRQAIKRRLRVSLLKRGEPAASVDELLAVVETWDADQLFAVELAYETMSQAHAPEPPSNVNVDMQRAMDEIISRARLVAARSRTPDLAPSLANGQVQGLWRERPTPAPAKLAERMRTARSDLRRGLARFRGIPIAAP